MTAPRPPTALLDACVLFGPPLRGLLLALAHASLFRALWTDDIVNECETALHRRSGGALRLDDALPEGRIDGHHRLVPALSLPDPADRHVLAAAIVAGADTIVTWNRRDFPPRTLCPYGITALDPDAFILDLIARDHPAALEVLQRHHADLRRERLFRTAKALAPGPNPL